ncbi:MAG TPA: 16S rRNA (guanine(966)-N(2))-methyltransferase RsmD [Candidatus Acidoferrum sp.]|nr:16S rRNA (guanine(966)-N(2))-methyltransferase RsmD [Candidatus Acidoferrum sp.]
MPDAGRVIAGSAKGARLKSPPGRGTRPLADRVKQTLFAILEPSLPGARFLDLFAGSGAAGIEALSRGAATATFVEVDERAAATIRENLDRAGFGPPAAAVTRLNVLDLLDMYDRGFTRDQFDIVFVDPPYDNRTVLSDTIYMLGTSGAPVAPEGRVIAKHFWRTPLPEATGLLASERQRRFGETTLTFYRRVRPVDKQEG